MDTASETLNVNSADIFDEIQQNVLKVVKNNNNSVTNESEPSAFDCLSSEFLLPPSFTEENGEPQLYAVEHDELQPISSPFMVPGIYKKIDTNAFKNPMRKWEHNGNVFLTASESHGRIVRNTDFHKFYVCENEITNENQFEQQPRKVILIKDTEQDESTTDAVTYQAPAEHFNLPKKWDALSKLAYNILKLSSCDHTVIINRNRNEIVRSEKSTNQKTIYRFINDEDLGIQPPDEIIDQQAKVVESPKLNKKLGRPRKRPIDVIDNDNKTSNELTPKAAKFLREEVQKTPEKSIITTPITCSRFGRVLKSVKTLVVSPENVDNSFENPSSIVENLKDKNYVCNLKPKQDGDTPDNVEEQQPVPIATSSPTKRNVPPDSICPTCKKIFLGRRLKRHFVQNPDHMKSPTPPPVIPAVQGSPQEEISLFRFLVSKLQKSNLNEDQRADLFLHELNDLVEQLQLRSSRLIRNTSGLHFVNSRTSRVLGIPEGQYALDMTAIDAPPEPEMNFDINAHTIPSTNTRSLDYTALSLDDTLTDEAAQKLNLSAGGKILPPSEESLLRAVDDLVPPSSISKLVPTNLLNRPVTSTSVSSNAIETLVPHYDHASDNAVEAMTIKESNSVRRAPPILDLSVDFFQFKTK